MNLLVAGQASLGREKRGRQEFRAITLMNVFLIVFLDKPTKIECVGCVSKDTSILLRNHLNQNRVTSAQLICV